MVLVCRQTGRGNFWPHSCGSVPWLREHSYKNPADKGGSVRHIALAYKMKEQLCVWKCDGVVCTEVCTGVCTVENIIEKRGRGVQDLLLEDQRL